MRGGIEASDGALSCLDAAADDIRARSILRVLSMGER